MNATEYGIFCKAEDEKRLVKNLNAFLVDSGFRKMHRRVATGTLNLDHPTRYDHYYCQFLKEIPRWYFDLHPNVDLDGRARFPDRPEVAWTLFASKTCPELNTEADDATLDQFFASLARSVGFPTEVLHVYGPGDELRR